ncbi:MAG: glucose-6-phosphate dehydrogenase [Nevskia sp.]|jgi:glucose-6-phosphate 1-dehydrogenase|nr:glucose-6-phosphate dehydrogenase [Nevskia sp.]MCK9385611.1 glucose-6-phosphate dehydrogenase [Nevskia sp.]
MAQPQSFDLIFFGGTGDLALRKLLPALYHRHRDSKDTSGWRIIGVSRQALDTAGYLQLVDSSCREFIADKDYDEASWQAFARCVEYLQIDGTQAADYSKLSALLTDSTDRVRVFYLSTAASLFASICGNLAQAGLVTPLSRVVLEKPLGLDLQSATQINESVGAIFEERQIFRIDHYLGKETVQNLIALRFANSIFEPLWHRASVRDVQITLAEQVGVEGRGGYYDHYGALRDMVQNHALQLLCILAMEPPSNNNPDEIRDEKLKVLRALRPFTPDDVRSRTVRGQYRAGAIDGKAVVGYLEEEGIPESSTTETFVALRANLDNWRWARVPFYIRTGKRMQDRVSEIVINFRAVPHAILPGNDNDDVNRLVIRLQPDEGIKLFVLAKVPGADMRVRPVHLNLDFGQTFKARQWDAYERLLMDVIGGNLTLFMRRDELDAAWRWIDPIHAAWAAQAEAPRPYTAGTWGPTASSALIVRDGLSWREES